MRDINPLKAEIARVFVSEMSHWGLDKDSRYADILTGVVAEKYKGVVQAFTQAVAQSEVTQKAEHKGFFARIFEKNSWDETPKIIVCAEGQDGVPDANFTPYPSVHLAAMKHLSAKANVDPDTVFSMGAHSRYSLDPMFGHKNWMVAGFKNAADAQAVINYARAEMGKMQAAHNRFEQVLHLANNGA